MASPIGKISTAAFPVVIVQPRARSEGSRARTEPVAALPGDPNLELLEVVAGQVSESTGEPCDASPSAAPGEADPSYRMELMGFIVGSLSRAAQAVRVVVPEEPEVDEEEPEPEVAAALPEVALPEGAVEKPDSVPDAEAEPAAPTSYGHDGHSREGAKPEGTLTRWA
ncbi:MAG: hypothetical protein ABIO70_14335 [Pseudomonadota bacterium]